ncbi:hypothetical protein [Tsukamurella paurometabola]|uniref:SHOCT domain-containing protein n=1 Tax=Tsukamurella paurometabola TaxID=2061 RepID=A0A3P8MCP7_TSUPA|nr:hypothetical protein [Tsukamurella paurometabola]UEA85411.1 hypothetical protein LK411_11585 [Tsukamurella paurometabola]VDR38033.1 Uncharacterised protein [Tsukamurella paurometabola]
MFPTTPEPQQDGFASFMETAFPYFFGALAVIAVVSLVVRAAIWLSNYNAAASRGEDYFTLETDLQVQALQSRTLGAERSIEERLAEIDDLAERGVIDADERAAARAKILAEG